jgi:hypothetical protein
MVIRTHQRKRCRETGALLTELMVAVVILTIAVIPLAYSFAKEHQYLRTCYQRAIAMEMVDGEMEVLLAGEWKAFNEGLHALTPRAQSATNLPAGKLQLTVTGKVLRLEWLPEIRNQGGKIVREATAQ